MPTLNVKIEPLTREAFAPYGDVIESEGAEHFSINDGAIERFHDLAKVDVGVGEEGRTLVSMVQCNRTSSLPYKVPLIERHPLGSQAFIPLDDTPVIVLVAPPGEEVAPADLRAFVTNGKQGINYQRAIWHMPLIALKAGQRLIVVDRGGPGNNCEEYYFPDHEIILDY
ncbi:MAG: ureidoglycolate lyase [Pseudomonadales bacterium]